MIVISPVSGLGNGSKIVSKIDSEENDGTFGFNGPGGEGYPLPGSHLSFSFNPQS